MNLDRLIDFNEKRPELPPLHTLIIYRWLCRMVIQQRHRYRMGARRIQRLLKQGRINVFQQAIAKQHLDQLRQLGEACNTHLDQVGNFLSDFTRQMAVAEYPPEHLAALFNIPTTRLLSKIEEVRGDDRAVTVFDLIFHHAECQDPGCVFVPNDDSMPLFNAVMANFMAEMERNHELRETMNQGFKKFFPDAQWMYLQPPGVDGRRAAYQEQPPLVVHRPDGTTRTVDRPMRLIGYTQREQP